MNLRRCLSVQFLLALLPTVSLFARDHIDLKRITPVPATEQIPVADFFRPSLFEDPRLNPSGTYLAALVSSGEDRHDLIVYDLKTKKIERLNGDFGVDIYYVDWLDDHRLIFGLGLNREYGIGLCAADRGHLDECYPLLQYVGSRLLAIPQNDRLRPLVTIHAESLNAGHWDQVATLNTEERTRTVLNLVYSDRTYDNLMDVQDANQQHIVNTQTGPKTGLDVGFLPDNHGHLEYGFTADDGVFSMYQLAGSKWVKCPVNLDKVDVLDFGQTDGEAIVLGPRQKGKPRALQFVDAKTGKLGEVILEDKAYDPDGYLYHDPRTHLVIGEFYNRDGPQSVWFNKSYRGLQKILNGFFPNLVVRILDSDEASRLFLVETYSDRQPEVYYSVNMTTHTVGLIKKSKPWIDPGRMRPMKIMKYRTRDGRWLDAYLTFPAGASKKHLPPLVVLPHGFLGYVRTSFYARRTRDTWGYDPEVQFLASRGYAVLQPNYRGSAGYEWMFSDKENWDFRGMSEDVNDATREVIASGFVDGHRVAIMGSGFGGYLAVEGAADAPNLYRCAVAIDGIFDWANLIEERKYWQYDDPSYGVMRRKIGDPRKDPAKFDAISPIDHVNRIGTPIFVAYERISEDLMEQSKRLTSRLDRHSVPCVAMPIGDDHNGLGHLNFRVELYTRIEEFLSKYLRPIPSAATSGTGAH